ncbi:MAG: hypothetical protein M1823_005806 [Watsoniomyces obsoletus]|nr:MAG: hypothetical protein M1823_005806 [Watsoniomyces obsoletus]
MLDAASTTDAPHPLASGPTELRPERVPTVTSTHGVPSSTRDPRTKSLVPNGQELVVLTGLSPRTTCPSKGRGRKSWSVRAVRADHGEERVSSEGGPAWGSSLSNCSVLTSVLSSLGAIWRLQRRRRGTGGWDEETSCDLPRSARPRRTRAHVAEGAQWRRRGSHTPRASGAGEDDVGWDGTGPTPVWGTEQTPEVGPAEERKSEIMEEMTGQERSEGGEARRTEQDEKRKPLEDDGCAGGR